MTDTRDEVDLRGCEDLVAGDQIAGARGYQEDDYRTAGFPDGDPDGCDLLLVLADGMGGHRGGARASRLAVSTFVDTFRHAGGGVAARLRASLEAANAEVGRGAAEDAACAGMGCTLVACVVTDDGAAHWISVGDSPLWRLRGGADEEDGAIDRLNADHSMRPVLEELVRLGRLAPDEAEGAHQLRSALTGEELTLVDESAPPVRLGAGDRVLLASDGLETLPPGGDPAPVRRAADVDGDGVGPAAGRRGGGEAVTGQRHRARLPAPRGGGHSAPLRAPHGRHAADRP